MSGSAQEILRDIELYSDGRDYRLLQLPPKAITLAAGVLAESGLAFSAMIADKDEVSLLLPDDACQEFSARLGRATFSEKRYRLITFDATLEPDLVGFIARVSAALAAQSIPILTFAAYSRDHIFVPAESFDLAIHTLRTLTVQSQKDA